MRVEIEINPVPAFDIPSPIFHSAPSVSRHIHSGAERIVTGISGNGAVFLKPGPWENTQGDHPGSFN